MDKNPKYDLVQYIDDQLLHIAKIRNVGEQVDYCNVIVNMTQGVMSAADAYVYDNCMRGKWSLFKYRVRSANFFTLKLENYNTLYDHILAHRDNNSRFKELHSICDFLHYYFRTIELYDKLQCDKYIEYIDFEKKSTNNINQQMKEYNPELYNKYLKQYTET